MKWQNYTVVAQWEDGYIERFIQLAATPIQAQINAESVLGEDYEPGWTIIDVYEEQ